MGTDAPMAMGWRAVNRVPDPTSVEAEEGCFPSFEKAASPVSVASAALLLSLPCWPQVEQR